MEFFLKPLKTTIIKPIFKSGDAKDPSSYRPKNILSNFAKLFEKFSATRIVEFIKKFKVFSSSKHVYLQYKQIVYFSIFQSPLGYGIIF